MKLYHLTQHRWIHATRAPSPAKAANREYIIPLICPSESWAAAASSSHQRPFRCMRQETALLPLLYLIDKLLLLPHFVRAQLLFTPKTALSRPLCAASFGDF
jgi:hypothetical protein